MTELEEWKKIILALPDHVFFDIVRNYLGDIKTPFNKHNLVDQLGNFLLESETVEKILSLLDEDDAVMLSAVSLMENSTLQQLYQLFRDDEYYKFYSHLLNLEERMLICSRKGNDGSIHIMISPIYRKILLEKVVDYDLVIKSELITPEHEDRCPWWSLGYISAFLSFVLKNPDCLKNDHTFKTRYLEQLVKILSADADSVSVIMDVLLRISLVSCSADGVVINNRNFRALSELGPDDFTSMIWRCYFGERQGERFFLYLIRNLEYGRCWDGVSLARLIRYCAIRTDFSMNDLVEVTKSRLLHGDFLKQKGDVYFRRAYCEDPAHGYLVVQPNFSVYAGGTLGVHDSLMLALCADIIDFDRVSRYELTKGSLGRAFSAGLSADSVINFMETLAGSALPQNVIFTIKSWEEEYSSLAVFDGYVVQTVPRMGLILESNSDFRNRIGRKLADGIYFFTRGNYAEIRHFMEKTAGRKIDILSGEPEDLGLPYSSEVSLPDVLKLDGTAGHGWKNAAEDDSGRFLNRIESLNMLQEQKDVLADRVSRKIILFQKQLDHGTAKYEKNEARGIDYTGKLRLCQQVMDAGGYFLEIQMVGDDSCFMMRPLRFRKSDGDMILQGSEILSGHNIEVAVRKIMMVRKVRTSLMD